MQQIAEPEGTRAWGVPRPSLAAALALLCGQALAHELRWEHAEPLWFLAACAAGVTGLAWGRARLVLASWFVAFACIGGAGEASLLARESTSCAWLDRAQPHLARFAEASGKVASVPRRSGNGWQFWLKPGAVVASAGESTIHLAPIPVSLRGSAPPMIPGDSVVLRGRAFELDHASGPTSMDRWQRARGAVMRFDASSIEESRADASGAVRGLHRIADRLRKGLDELLAESLPSHTRGLLAAMMIGDVSGLDSDTMTAFQRTGLVHLFSVSGFHTMIVGAMTLRLLALLGMARWMRAAAFIPALLLFCAVAGFEAPVLRSALLLTAAVAGTFARRPIDSLASLSTVFVGVAIVSPQAPHQLDCQLTFLCALALVAASPWNRRFEERVGPWLGRSWKSAIILYVAEVAFASAVVQLVVAPLLATWFGQVSLVAPLANVLLASITSIVIAIGFIGAILGIAIPGLAELMLGALHPALFAIDETTRALSSIPFASVEGAPWPSALGVAWLAAIFAAPWMVERLPTKRALRGTAALACIASPLVAFILPARIGAPELTIHFIDVGQGDAILLETRDGRYGLVDAGPDGAALRWLRAKGVRELDWMLATHADLDHIGGMPRIVQDISVRTLFFGGLPSTSTTFNSLMRAVDEKQIEATQLSRGARMSFGEPPIELEGLHPSPDFLSGGTERNEASVVLLVRTPSGATALLTGDAEEGAERSMLADGEITRVDLLKAGHHGSRSSSSADFVAAAAPRIAVMSCSAANNFGHPAPEVMERLAAEGIDVWRTDFDGTVVLRVMGDGRCTIEASRREGILAFDSATAQSALIHP